jgi:hypothetical protein
MMLAIYLGRVYRMGDDLNACRLLDEETGDDVVRIDYGSESLIVDPTDAQVEAARRDEAIPPASCALCDDQPPRHEDEWRFFTPDGYGVCDVCGQQGRHHVIGVHTQ